MEGKEKLCLKLIGKFKMAVGDWLCDVMKYTYIPIRIKEVLVRSGLGCDWKGIILMDKLFLVSPT